MKSEYYIISAGGLFWSNAQGWVELEQATKFTLNERYQLNLPIGGDWIDENLVKMKGE